MASCKLADFWIFGDDPLFFDSTDIGNLKDRGAGRLKATLRGV